MKNLIQKYNKENSILVISSYPEKGVLYSGKVCAVGGFAKNTIQSFQNHLNQQNEKINFIVLTIATGEREVYVENNVLVIRCFKRNNPFSYFYLIKELLKFNKVKDVLVEFEFASYGNVKTTGLFPLVLLMLRLLSKNTVFVLHQVLTDISSISGHIGFAKRSPKTYVFNFLLKLFYIFLTIFPQKIVVLEEFFKRSLFGLTNLNKVIVIPHGVDKNIKNIAKNKARGKLGISKNDFVLLYFGYLTWYKGADWLVENSGSLLKIKNKKVKLLIAGGESFTQKNKPHYKNFVQKIYKFAKRNKSIIITGFVEEKEIPLYFAASDIVVLPYRTMLSSSGPLSLAFSYSKPVLMSEALEKYLYSSDFQEVLKKTGLYPNDLFFSLKNKELFQKIEELDSEKLDKLIQFSKLIREKRAFSNLGRTYLKLFAHNSKKVAFLSPTFSFSKISQAWNYIFAKSPFSLNS